MQPAWHVALSLPGRTLLSLGEAGRRRAVRLLARDVGGQCLLFSLVDDHLHLALPGPETEVRQRVERLARRLEPMCGYVPQISVFKPIDGRGHLASLARYFVRQPAHHHHAEHPALHAGTCLADLIGARRVDGLHLPDREWMPRFWQRDVLAEVGLQRQPLDPLPVSEIRRVGALGLADAALAAFCIGPGWDSAGRTPTRARARHIAVFLGAQSGLACSDLGDATEASRWTVNRLTKLPPSDTDCLVVRTRLALERVVVAAAIEAATAALRAADEERRQARAQLA